MNVKSVPYEFTVVTIQIPVKNPGRNSVIKNFNNISAVYLCRKEPKK